MRRIITTTVVSFGALLGLVAFSATPALAGSAWWHVSSGSRPTYLHRLGLPNSPGTDEVQEVTVTGPSGAFYMLERMTPAQAANELCVVNGENRCAESHVGDSAAVV